MAPVKVQVQVQGAMCAMGVSLLPPDGLPGPDEESALFLQDVVSPPEHGPREAITTRNERFVSTAALNQRRCWASGRQIAGDWTGRSISGLPGGAGQSGQSLATISRRRFSAPWSDRSPAPGRSDRGRERCQAVTFRPVRRWSIDHAMLWLGRPRVQCLPGPPVACHRPPYAGRCL
jgi:hypothetical protein